MLSVWHLVAWAHTFQDRCHTTGNAAVQTWAERSCREKDVALAISQWAAPQIGRGRFAMQKQAAHRTDLMEPYHEPLQSWMHPAIKTWPTTLNFKPRVNLPDSVKKQTWPKYNIWPITVHSSVQFTQAHSQAHTDTHTQMIIWVSRLSQPGLPWTCTTHNSITPFVSFLNCSVVSKRFWGLITRKSYDYLTMW